MINLLFLSLLSFTSILAFPLNLKDLKPITGSKYSLLNSSPNGSFLTFMDKRHKCYLYSIKDQKMVSQFKQENKQIPVNIYQDTDFTILAASSNGFVTRYDIANNISISNKELETPLPKIIDYIDLGGSFYAYLRVETSK